MLACSFYPTGLGLGFFEEDLDSDLDFDLRTVDLDLTVAGLVTSLAILCQTNGLTLVL